ncbi:hypothetical protein [Qipengyuania thermophila]|uniref:hypothetical protein n=1 Tax=Qipengyuania thermophila TaxID=2509361 RepID=UPI0013ED88F3|nr:hypothetical protein [Qipengyuania thermophila]
MEARHFESSENRIELVARPEFAAEMGRRGRERVGREFVVDRAVEPLLAAFRATS